MIALFLILNLAISIFNAWSVGRGWYETKQIGGFPRFMSWMGAIMAAVGFSWCYLIVLSFIAGPSGFHVLAPKYVKMMVEMGYLALILPLIGSGIAITIDSWIYFWKTRSLSSGAVAAYNTFADIYNISEALTEVPSAFGDIGDVLKGGDDDDGAMVLLAIMLVVIALGAGIFTTYYIVKTVSKNTVRERRMDLEFRRQSQQANG